MGLRLRLDSVSTLRVTTRLAPWLTTRVTIRLAILLAFGSLLAPSAHAAGFRRADSNPDGVVNITDGITTLNFLFLGGPDLRCRDAADADDSGVVNITDAIFSFAFLFLGGPPPPAPGPFACGLDPSADGLDCADYAPANPALRCGGSPPAISGLSAPESIPLGATAQVRFFASDADADIALIEIQEDDERASAVPAQLLGIAGAGGEASIEVRARDLSFAAAKDFSVVLIDDAGLRSEAVSFAVALRGSSQGGSPPTIVSLDPASSAWTRPMGESDRLRPRLRIAYADPDGDIARLRIRLSGPEAEAIEAEEEAPAFGITGNDGVVDWSPFSFRSGSPTGTYLAVVAAIDRSGQVGEAVAASIDLLESGGSAPLFVAGFEPAQGGAGTEVLIMGTGFDPEAPERNLVEMSEFPLAILEATETQLRAVVPEGAPTARLVVSNERGRAASAGFFVVPPSVSLLPLEAEVPVGRSLRFEAQAVSAPDPSLEWLVDGLVGGSAAAGTVSPEGVYLAPLVPPPGASVTLEARLAADRSVRGTATVRVAPPASWPGRTRILAATGGAVASLDGLASVSVPAGALGADSLIEIDVIPRASLPVPPAGFRIAGAVALGPSGLVFEEPVLVSIPLVRYIRPGTRLPVQFHVEGTGYVDEGLSAVVSASGEVATALLPHFSTPIVLEQAPESGSGLQPQVLTLDGISPGEAQEGLRVPVLVTGSPLDGYLDRVEVLTEAGESTEDLSVGTLYPAGDRVGFLLRIGTIPDLGEGQRRTYRLRIFRARTLEPAEVSFDVLGLDELLVSRGDTLALVDPAPRRFSEVNILGALRVYSGRLEIESTGRVGILGPVDSSGTSGQHAPGWLCGGLGSGEGPESCGRGGSKDGRGGLGRERETLGEVAGESLAALFSSIPIIGGAIGSLVREVLDSPDPEHDGAHAPTCASDRIEGCNYSLSPQGVGGKAGASIDLEEAREEAAELIEACTSCIEALVAGNPGGVTSCAGIKGEIEDVLDLIGDFAEGPTGKRGFGALPRGWGGGGGGAGRFKTLGFEILELLGLSDAGLFALALDGGGGGGGGGPAHPVSIVTGADINIMSPLSESGLEDLIHLLPPGTPIDRILDGLPLGRITAEGGNGGNGSETGRLTVTTNNVLVKPILDAIPWPDAPAFQGGGGGGGAGSSVTLGAAWKVTHSGALEEQVSAKGGLGGFGGRTILDPENAHVRTRTERSSASKGAPGRVFLDGSESAYAFRPIDDDGRFQLGNFVTNRSLLDVRFRGLGVDPNEVVLRSDAGEERVFASTYLESEGQHHVSILLFSGFNTVEAGHELLDNRILSVFADADSDGLSDADETWLYLDPANPDTDGDTFSDAQEILLGSNPRNPDGDRDGLPDPEEFALGTDPVGSDTDEDGVNDGAEVLLGFDALEDTSHPTAIPGGTLLAATAYGFLSILDPATGRTGALGKAAGGFGFGLAHDGSGTLFIASFSRLTTVDPFVHDSQQNLTETEIGEFGQIAGTTIRASQIAFHPGDGILYGVELGPAPGFFETGQLLSISLASGEATRVGALGASAIHALAVDASGKLFASLEGDSTTDRLVELDRTTGGISAERGPIGFPSVFGLAFDGSGTLWASALRSGIEGQILTIDAATGLGTHVVDVDRAVFGLSFVACGAGCAQPFTEYEVASDCESVTALDLDADGRKDLVVGRSMGLSILANLGNGNFASSVDLPTDLLFVSNLAVGEFTGDALPDVLGTVETGSRPGLAVFPAEGAGMLGAPLITLLSPSLGYVKALDLGDLDGDGDLDIKALVTVFNPSGTTSAWSILSNGAGGFTVGPVTGGLGFPDSVALGDIDEDGKLDMAIVQTGSFNIPLYLGDGAGGFAFLRNVPTVGTAPNSIRLVDLNDDGHLDMAHANTLPEGVVTILGAGDGTFATTRFFPPAGFYPGGLAVSDIDGDGRVDLVTTDWESGALSLFLGLGDGRLAPAVPLALPQGFPEHVWAFELNGNAKADIAVTLQRSASLDAVGVGLDVR